MVDYVNTQTSVPKNIAIYVKLLAIEHYGSLNGMYADVLIKFLSKAPWKANPPLPWRMAKAHSPSFGKNKLMPDVSWVPMNMMLSSALVDKIKEELVIINSTSEKNVSLRTFLYTAIYWWCAYVMPSKNSGL